MGKFSTTFSTFKKDGGKTAIRTEKRHSKQNECKLFICNCKNLKSNEILLSSQTKKGIGYAFHANN